MRRVILGLAFLAMGGVGGALEACGGDDSAGAGPGGADASSDATAIDGSKADGATGDAAAIDAGGSDGSSNDGGAACAPPSDATKTALCVVVAPEAIQFLPGNVDFDGKGILAVEIYDVANLLTADGGTRAPLQSAVFPAADAGADAGEVDLSAALPTIRFDNLPAGTLYARVLFVDARATQQLGAGWWLGGYDFSNGIQPPQLLKPVGTNVGAGSTATVDLVALRRLNVTLTNAATPVGNAQGPATVVATPDLVPGPSSRIFGVGRNACAKLAGQADEVNGFVIGKGPYYAVASLNDFDIDASLPPGALVSVAPVDGGFQNPSSTQLTYAPNAYVVDHAVTLDYAVPYPDAGADPVACP